MPLLFEGLFFKKQENRLIGRKDCWQIAFFVLFAIWHFSLGIGIYLIRMRTRKWQERFHCFSLKHKPRAFRHPFFSCYSCPSSFHLNYGQSHRKSLFDANNYNNIISLIGLLWRQSSHDECQSCNGFSCIQNTTSFKMPWSFNWNSDHFHAFIVWVFMNSYCY